MRCGSKSARSIVSNKYWVNVSTVYSEFSQHAEEPDMRMIDNENEHRSRTPTRAPKVGDRTWPPEGWF